MNAPTHIPHEQIYSAPQLYDLAFSYRDYEAECEFLRSIYRRRHGHGATSFLEIAAGPAEHSICLAQRGLSCAAVDLSPQMVRYGRSKAAAAGVELDYTAQDMTSFRVNGRRQLAACMLDSMSYLLTDRQVLAHLDCMACALELGGLYVVELAHPRDTGAREKTRQTWSVRDASGELSVTWSAVPGGFDPASSSTDVHARFVYRALTGVEQVVDARSVQRGFGIAEFDRLVAASGAFRLLETFGAFDTSTPFSPRGNAWRMIPVLQRC